ncbi:MAG TPA: ribosome-associated translation inhibitor RaiA [Chthoniobacterales bacterium]|jgi:putative sigma-54 modulation protein
MTNLPIHITTHHLSLSDPLRRFTRKKITPITRFANDALAAEIVLRRHGGATTCFSASARLALPGRDVHGRAIDSNLYVAIGRLVTKLGRLLRKRKTRLAKSFTRSRIRKSGKSPQPSALSVAKASPEPSAEPDRVRPREGGQEMRVFPFRRRAPFPFAPVHGEESLTGTDR